MKNLTRRQMLGYGAAGLGLVGPRQTMPRPPKPSVLTRMEALLKDPGRLQEQLQAEAARVMEATRVDSEQGTFHMPSAFTYPSFFAWDSGWNVISLSVLDPELAYQELATVFKMQTPSGFVPHEVMLEEFPEKSLARKAVKFLLGRQLFDEQKRSRIIDPPSFILAARVLYQRTRDPRVFELLPAMEKCLEYLTGPRNLFGDGLVAIVHPWESGTDAAPIFDEPLGTSPRSPFFLLDYAAVYSRLLNCYADLDWDLPRLAEKNWFVMEEVGMNSLTAAGLDAVSELYLAAADYTEKNSLNSAAAAESEGLRQRAGFYHEKAGAMVRKMEELLWDEERGFFFPRFDLKKRKLIKRTCLTGLLPLLTRRLSLDKARRLVKDYLVSPRHFYSPFLVPFNSLSELEQERIPAEKSLLWRGHCIWINMNWMAARAAAQAGREDLPREITRKTAALVAASGFREYYDSRTGEGKGAEGFTWPALVLDLIGTFGL